jgi:hypothetical protein
VRPAPLIRKGFFKTKPKNGLPRINGLAAFFKPWNSASPKVGVTSRPLPRQPAHIRHSPNPNPDHSPNPNPDRTNRRNTCGRNTCGRNTCDRDGNRRSDDHGNRRSDDHGNRRSDDHGNRHDRDRRMPLLETTKQPPLHRRETAFEAFGSSIFLPMGADKGALNALPNALNARCHTRVPTVALALTPSTLGALLGELNW